MAQSYDEHGDCLGTDGLFGELDTDFVMSDMQFIQQVRDQIRAIRSTPFYKHNRRDALPETIGMDLYTRFFVNTLGDKDKTLAMELHVERSREFLDMIENSLPTEEELDKELADSVDHGMRFDGMFRPDRKDSLTKKNIQGIIFDKYQHFSGFAFRRDGKKHDDYILPVEYENRISELSLEPMSPQFLLKNSHEHTRLVGFRSGKRCSSSQTARTLMPVFYSVNEDMCKNVLKPLA